MRRRLLSSKSKTPRQRRKSKLKAGLDRDINLEFLCQIMRGVPEKALEAELSRLRQKAIWKLVDLLDYTPEELEEIVRPATARSLALYLPSQSPLSSPCLSPHLSHDKNSPLLRNRLALHIGVQDNGEFDNSPSLGSRKVKLHLGDFEEDHDFLISLHILQNLMPFSDREAVQQDLEKLTTAGIVHMNQIAEQSQEELQAIVGPATARMLKDVAKKDSALSNPFLSISPQSTSKHYFPRKVSEELF